MKERDGIGGSLAEMVFKRCCWNRNCGRYENNGISDSDGTGFWNVALDATIMVEGRANVKSIFTMETP